MDVTGRKYCINCPELIFSFDFSPISDHLYIGYVTGGIQQYSYSMNSSRLLNTIAPKSSNTREHFSCRALSCNTDGHSILTGYENGELKLYDTELSVEQWKPSSVLQTGINALLCVDSNLYISGDDEGEIRMWDIRQNTPVDTNKSCEEVITNIIYDSDTSKLVFSSDDGSITRYNYKRRRVEDHVNPFDEQILSVAYIKNKKNIVFGTAEGSLGILQSTNWDDLCGKFNGHPDSIESIITVDNDSVITASADGYIRLVNIIPNKFVDVIGHHKGQSIDNIKWSKDKGIFGCSYSTKHLALWDVNLLFEEKDCDSEEDDMETRQTENNGTNIQEKIIYASHESSLIQSKNKKVTDGGARLTHFDSQNTKTNHDGSSDSNSDNMSDCSVDADNNIDDGIEEEESINRNIGPNIKHNKNIADKVVNKKGGIDRNSITNTKRTKYNEIIDNRGANTSDSDIDNNDNVNSDSQSSNNEMSTESDGSTSPDNSRTKNSQNQRKAGKHPNPRDIQSKPNKKQKRPGRNFYADM